VNTFQEALAMSKTLCPWGTEGRDETVMDEGRSTAASEAPAVEAAWRKEDNPHRGSFWRALGEALGLVSVRS
jgi:hypothetical protein